MDKIKIEGLEPNQLNPHNFGGKCARATVVLQKAAADKAINWNEGIAAIATTDQPALVVDMERWQVVREILPMRYAQSPAEDKLVLLDTHSYKTVHNVLGSAFKWSTTATELLCKIFISESEDKIRKKVEENVICAVSLGYETDKNYTVEIPKGAKVTIDGADFENDYDDDYPLLVRTWWKRMELSLVPIGADELAKLKRAKENGIKSDDPEMQKILNEILNNQRELDNKINNIKLKEANMPDTKEKTPEQLRGEKVASILKIGKERFDGKYLSLANERASEILQGKEDISVESFQNEIFDLMVKNGGGHETPGSQLGLSGKEIKEFSLTRGIRTILDGGNSDELEMSKQISKNIGKTPSGKGLFVPMEIINRGLRNHPMFEKYAQRAFTAADNGGNFVPEDFRPDLLSMFLRNDTALGRLGVTILTGLKGPITIPKVTSGLTAYSVAENTAGALSSIVTDLQTSQVNHITVNTEYGKQLFYESSISVDSLLMNDGNQELDVKIDYLGINGSGSGNEPTGLLNISGIPSVDVSALTWKKILGFKKALKKANTLKGQLKWLGSPDVEAELMGTPKVEMQAIFLMNDNGSMAAYDSVISNQVSDQILAFGDWSEFFLLNYGVREVTVDPYTKADSWMVRLIWHDLIDCLVRRNASFGISDNVPLTA